MIISGKSFFLDKEKTKMLDGTVYVISQKKRIKNKIPYIMRHNSFTLKVPPRCILVFSQKESLNFGIQK